MLTADSTALHASAVDAARDAVRAPGSRRLRLLHVVGPVTDEVFSFLGPATRALANDGHDQKIVVIDVPAHRHNVSRFEHHAAVVKVAGTSNPAVVWKRMFGACVAEFAHPDLGAVHVHGMLPFMVASLGLRASGVKAPVVFSPHGSRSLGKLRFAGNLAMLASRAVTRTSAMVTMPGEADAIGKWDAKDVVESPVGDAFFLVPRQEAEAPLIVTGGRHGSIRSTEVFTQLAVLLSGEELGLRFDWLGSVPEVAQQPLQAAGVTVSPIVGDEACAAHLATGWMYVAPWSTRGFPLFLAQAMASGLPCVALDCEQHRQLIQDGVTGFLCASEQEMVRQIAGLVDNEALRKKMGIAARAVAEARFSEANFTDKLLTAYSTRW